MLEKFYACCRAILPTTWSPGMSVWNILGRIIDKINSIIDALEELKEYTDDEIANLQIQINQTNNRINQTNDEIKDIRAKYYILNQNLEELKSYTDEKLSKLYELIFTNNAYIKGWVERQIEELINSLPKYFKLPVTNPVTGETDSIQNALDMMYDVLRCGAFTAGEYDYLNLTAQEYDKYNLTALQYDVCAKQYILRNPLNYMFNPLTGLLTPVKEVVIDLFNYHRQSALTAQEYDNLELTAISFDDKQLTAYNYDFLGVA